MSLVLILLLLLVLGAPLIVLAVYLVRRTVLHERKLREDGYLDG